MYTVLRDTKEKEGHGWYFMPNSSCKEMVDLSLPTGDYTLVGYETKLTIERKANTAELAKNIYEARFTRELERMREFQHPFLILEFTANDVLHFPLNSGIPKYLWGKIKTTSYSLLKSIIEMELHYPTIKIIFAGSHGKDIASSIFKRMVELNEQPAESKKIPKRTRKTTKLNKS